MKKLFFILYFLTATCVFSQNNLLTFRIDKYGYSQELWVTNNSYAILTIAVEFNTLDNCLPNNARDYDVIESSDNIKIAELVQNDKTYAWDWNYKYWWRLGSADARHSDEIVYQLPFERGSSYKLIQGYNASFSHFGEIAYAVDFNMPENTSVLACRTGKFVQTESSFSEGGVKDDFRNKVNMVRILHSDGTIGNYYHFVYGGVHVIPGQDVKAGQIIGYSGNTGYSSAPHLHFDVSKPLNGKESETIPVKFRTSSSTSEQLIQGNNYTAP